MCIFITKSNSSCQGSHFTGVGTDPTHPTAVVTGLNGDLPHWGMRLWLHCSPVSPPGGVWGGQWPPLPPLCAWHLLSVTRVPHARREPSSPSGGYQEVSWLDTSSSLCLHPEHVSDCVRMPLLARAACSWSLWLLLGRRAKGRAQGSGLAPTVGSCPRQGSPGTSISPYHLCGSLPLWF